ncbi:hypothetical protein [Sphingomonas sp. NPDC079357]|uniref:hypothetical protein n=1 Tax=Sphingomonas sp. NPDC079357 TaxID=3364518 RepID=UPI003850B651
MTKRSVSDPLLALLQQAGLAPEDIDKALDRQAARWTHTLLRHGHPYVRRLRTSTGFNAVGISRRYRRLLIDIEQRGSDGGLLWHYREFGRANCLFRCKGAIPDTTLTALPGRLLGNLIQPYPALSAATIHDAVATRDAWIELTVEPGWQVF